ncbi:TetR/AcrR family transcriptional regulator [Promicromonospora sp. Populi]|uniref:TetR/AcrR family transcriptional regulator n=1 Tax=Promicromonospora sp. Populi TaxID=3239420 RepID=UPI0034E2C1E3
MTPSDYHRQNLRGTLLELAEQTVRTAGVEALSLRQLARDAGVSHAAPARHFRDRRALLDALALAGFERLDASIDAAAAGEGPFTVRFRGAAHAYVGFAVENTELLGLMFTIKHEEGASAELVETARRAIDTTVALLARGQAEGEVAPGDPERLAQVVFATVQGVAMLVTGGLLDGTTATELTDSAVDVLLRALPVPSDEGARAVLADG